jgi:hypothetical protein
MTFFFRYASKEINRLADKELKNSIKKEKRELMKQKRIKKQYCIYFKNNS